MLCRCAPRPQPKEPPPATWQRLRRAPQKSTYCRSSPSPRRTPVAGLGTPWAVSSSPAPLPTDAALPCSRPAGSRPAGSAASHTAAPACSPLWVSPPAPREWPGLPCHTSVRSAAPASDALPSSQASFIAPPGRERRQTLTPCALVAHARRCTGRRAAR